MTKKEDQQNALEIINSRSLSHFRIAVQGDDARIDLAGSTRCVSGVYIFGRSQSNTPQQTKVVFQGIQRTNDTPIPIGATSLTNGRDADLINLPRPICDLKTFQLRVRQDSARIDFVAIQFGNGDIQQIPIRTQFACGSKSAWKDLNGQNRCIDKIIILGRSNGRTARQAVVEFWALLD